jgi:bifunctional non-homologous end joining protein LigD
MLARRIRTDGFVDPCIPSRAPKPPSGPDWVHEVKHDGYRLIVRRDGAMVRLFTRRGYDWTERYPAIANAAAKLKARSFTLDGEAVVCGVDGVAVFDALHRRGRVTDAILQAFDLLELLPLSRRKDRLARLLGRVPVGIALKEHTDARGELVGPVCASTLPAAGSFSGSNFSPFWVVGVGVETQIWDRWTGRIEYLYLQSGSITDTFVVSGGTLAATRTMYDNVIRTGLNYHF